MTLKKLLRLLCFSSFFVFVAGLLPAREASEKFRVVILTDMTHDDGNSLIRYLHYTPYFDTEAIVITPQLPDFTYDAEAPWEKGKRILDAYADLEAGFRRHSPDFTRANALRAVTKRGRGAIPIIWLTNERKFAGHIADRYVESEWGEITFGDWIGEGLNPNGESKDSPGSEFLQEVFLKDDPRPIYVLAWGGPITFVQALYRFRQRQGEEAFDALMAKLRIFSIHLQDITFDYLISLDEVQAMDCAGIGNVTSTFDGDRQSPGLLLHEVGHFWEYVKQDSPAFTNPAEVQKHNALTALYDAGGEGDSPSFFYLVSAQLGLNDPSDPTQGSWGSRFVPAGASFPAGYFNTCGVDASELLRWNEAILNDFMNRLDYPARAPDEVNHAPTVIVNGDSGRLPMNIVSRGGETLKLDARNSFDPDGDALSFRWFHYQDAGSYPKPLALQNADQPELTVDIPDDLDDRAAHLVLEVRDSGTPELVAYKRVILSGAH